MTAHALKTLAFALAASGTALAPGQIVVPASARRNDARHVLAHSNYLLYKGVWYGAHARATKSRAGIDGYYPSDIQAAYGLSAAGGSQAIAIVDPYHLPTSLNDFNVFSRQFGLPAETSTNATSSSNKVFQVVYASGAKPATDVDWGAEIALDIEWAHAVAPKAKIYLVECKDESFDSLFAGVRKASTLADVREVSMSFGQSEVEDGTINGDTAKYNSTFTAANVVYFAAAGDRSNDRNYPAASPNVVGVGGTSLNVANGTFLSETAWSGGGGGPSYVQALPDYQIGFTTATRGTPDMSAVGDPQTGCAVYDSTPDSEGNVGWGVYGGTSLSTPICAGIANARGNFATSSYAELQRQYGYAGTNRFRDITAGRSGVYAAQSGYDFVTGLGSPTYLFPTVAVAPTGVAVPLGTPVGGVPGNLGVKDNKAYLVRSVANGASQAAIVQGTFATSLNAGASRLGATVSVTGASAAPGTSLGLYNVSTGAWDAVADLALTTTSGTVNATVPNLASYFDASGTLRFRIVATDASAAPAVFRLGLDQVQLSVSTTN